MHQKEQQHSLAGLMDMHTTNLVDCALVRKGKGRVSGWAYKGYCCFHQAVHDTLSAPVVVWGRLPGVWMGEPCDACVGTLAGAKPDDEFNMSIGRLLLSSAAAAVIIDCFDRTYIP